MKLKPIMLVVFPEKLQLQTQTLIDIQKHLRKTNPEYWVLAIISPDTEDLYMNIFSWKSTSYANYAYFLDLIAPDKYEKLEMWRQNVIMGSWQYDLGDDEESDF